MSSIPGTVHRPPHLSGTTLAAFTLSLVTAALDPETGRWTPVEPAEPLDLTGAAVSIAWLDQAGTEVAEWVQGDDEKPGLAIPDPEDGQIVLGSGAPDPFDVPAGTTAIRGDLTIVLDGETFVPVTIHVPIIWGAE